MWKQSYWKFTRKQWFKRSPCHQRSGKNNNFAMSCQNCFALIEKMMKTLLGVRQMRVFHKFFAASSLIGPPKRQVYIKEYKCTLRFFHSSPWLLLCLSIRFTMKDNEIHDCSYLTSGHLEDEWWKSQKMQTIFHCSQVNFFHMSNTFFSSFESFFFCRCHFSSLRLELRWFLCWELWGTKLRKHHFYE